MKTTQQTALITGASSGIGYELAKVFAKNGYNLVLVARNTDRLNEIASDLRSQFSVENVVVIGKDLSQPNAPQEVYSEVQGFGIDVNVLVNNAGMGEYGAFATETDLDRELSIIQLNVVSLVHLTKLFLNDMVQANEGKILNLASIVSVIPNPFMAVYGATKAFVLSFTEALRNECKETNITVTALLPGATNTDFFHKAGAEGTRAHKQAQSADPAKVAQDGFDALMAGKDKVVSGLMNKSQAAASNLLPDTFLSQLMRKLMERPSEEENTESKVPSTASTLVSLAVIAGALFWGYKKYARKSLPI
ncbi:MULTISPECIES: SDR family oxidoreductase [unclassified Siphonobacter]|uniref:SDR family NAD(P)-dependent oxidoreductase n=1 Tax=unclassified Siphonobacter TaxID=2635712 RepID=UPI000CB5FF5C|nr:MULTISPECIES: SDR family oxidoreductase [unclassified Siphonobacter]MDQ1089253.1 short-subunit dehydrogenase [Siphonobacter sp. SORGH_AS_1065]MDR6195426.1 short-subunit dehydrogenase [Siphonobacter sp. SORGH_AS_0500]PKK34865.1 hypothetical protein BWI96_19835 [Siphonobacter sp. SORGH_AS_0500]